MLLVLSALMSSPFWSRYIFSCLEKIPNLEGSATAEHLSAFGPKVDPTFEQGITSEVAIAREALYIRV